MQPDCIALCGLWAAGRRCRDITPAAWPALHLKWYAGGEQGLAICSRSSSACYIIMNTEVKDMLV